jgi:hypothetical protein
MTHRSTCAAVALIAAFALGACSSSGSVKLSSKALCENAGGKYVGKTCQPGTAKSAAEMCQGYGGFFLVDEDFCHISK